LFQSEGEPLSNYTSEPIASNWDFLALVGPTASGKTHAAMRLSEHYLIELISMDSALVYQGMDIGTAKPSARELQSVPHHLINIRRADEPFSAADFAVQAKALVAEIRDRGAIPVVVGGTLLYFNAMVHGLDDLPAASQDTRQNILSEANAVGWPKMHEKLQLVDPTTAKRLAPNDSQRIGRALEVWMLTGQSISSFQSKYAIEKKELHGSNLLSHHLLSFEPQDRAWLHANIERRFDQMLRNGFLKESLSFFKNPQLNASMPSMRCVGYRQAWVFWQSIQTLMGDLPNPNDLQELTKTPEYELFVQSSLAATRQLAKRQLTWLRSMKDRQIIACDAQDFELQVQAHLKQVIEQHVLFKRFVK
jgi:tRNA dimethylallyltransferase